MATAGPVRVSYVSVHELESGKCGDEGEGRLHDRAPLAAAFMLRLRLAPFWARAACGPVIVSTFLFLTLIICVKTQAQMGLKSH